MGAIARTFACTATASALLCANPARAAAPETLSPVTPWNIDYGEKRCSAIRAFGTDEDSVTLLIDQFGPGDEFQLTLTGKRFAGWTDTSTKLQLRFGPGEDWQDMNYFSGDLGKVIPAIFTKGHIRLVSLSPGFLAARRKDASVEAPPVSEAQRAGVRSLDLRYGGKLVQIATGRLDRLFVALDTCTDQLVETWGFDPITMKSLRKKPKPLSSPATWFTSQDYPKSSAQRRERGMVAFRLNVDATGSITKCEVQKTTRDGDFGAVVCEALTKRGKFTPAIDAGGKPVAAYWRSSASFVLP